MNSAQKAADTRRKNKAKRQAIERSRRETVAALEKIIQSDDFSREAKETALFLLATVYRP